MRLLKTFKNSILIREKSLILKKQKSKPIGKLEDNKRIYYG